MKKTFFFLKLVLFLGVNPYTYSQNLNYSSLLIPTELKEDANAVIRDNSLEITVEAINKMVVHERTVITILNELGDRYASMYESYDNDTKITKLSAVIYNALGKEIKEFKSRDFSDVSAVDGGTLYSDSRVKYAEYTPITYPYTIVFESEYKTATTGFIPYWVPVKGYYLSVEKSSYKINNPTAIPWRNKNGNFDNFSVEFQKSETIVSGILKNQKAFEYENQAIPFRDLLPKSIVTLNKFYLKGTYGEYENWKQFGSWMNDNLLSGRNVLSEETILKVKELTKNTESSIEKAKIIYKYMQDRTRYISVQVGIGGWEPIAANEVDRVGYGDCKGLTNYTKALLDAVGVKSHYTIVYANEKRDIDEDFSSIQGNHIILNLPNDGEDIWLECTSQTMPFGFLGDFTDDRNVLVVTEEGGIIKRTSIFNDEENYQKITASIQLEVNGNLRGTIERMSTGIQYDNKSYYDTYSEEDLIKEYKSEVWSYNNNLEVASIHINNDKEKVEFIENIEVSINNYATINPQEYLFRVNVFNKNSYVPKRYRNRTLPLKISRGYKDVDEYEFTLPKGYVLDVLPPEKELNTKFGSYKISLEKINETTFKYHKSLLIKEGVYPKEEYKNYRSFRRSIAKYENLRIAINKKI